MSTREVAIVGVGQSNFSELYQNTDVPRDAYGLAAGALREALVDAGLGLSDLDGLICSRVDYGRMATVLGMQHPQIINSFEGSGRMSGVAVQTAAALIAEGRAETIALVYGNNGRSSAYKYAGQDIATDIAKHDRLYGMTSPGAYVAMMWRRYQYLYGAPDGALAPVAINNRFHASLNQAAVMNSEITTEEYLASRWIAEPLRLFDYCIINDGGVALILTSMDRAKDCRKTPVRIAASASSGNLTNYYTSTDFFYEPSRRVAKKVFSMAGLEPDEIDCLEIYDNFTPIVVFTLEGFGHSKRGEGWQWVSDGKLRFDRERPTNTCGGHTGESYMQGWSLHVEAVRQVRGEADLRQVPNCRTAQYMCASPIVTSHILVRD